MSDVVPIRPLVGAKPAADGEQSFLCCPCMGESNEHPGFAPVVIHDAAGWFVSALVCLGCEAHIDIDGGRPVAK